MKTTRKLSSLIPYVPVSLLALGGLSLAIQSACTAGSASSGSSKGAGDDATCGYEYYGVCYDDYADYAGTAGTASTATSAAGTSTATTPPSPTATATTSN